MANLFLPQPKFSSLRNLAPVLGKKIPSASTAVEVEVRQDLIRRQCTKATCGLHPRREFVFGLFTAVLYASAMVESANAAKRKPPPPPTEEKKDPSVTGLKAKVLASIKRKEALKEQIAKLREKGKPVNS